MQTTKQDYSYKVKIINPQRKSDAVVRYLHNCTSKFGSALDLRMKLIEELKDLVPDTMSFNVGYFEGQGHSKIWLVDKEDFLTMYRKYSRGEVSLWCDGRPDVDDQAVCKTKREDGVVSSKRQDREEEVDEIFKELKEKHGTKYDTPKLRLWARTICSKIHDDLDNPPDLPAFKTEGVLKKARRESLTDILTGAAVAFRNSIQPNSPSLSSHGSQCTPLQQVGISPGKAVDLRMRNFEQLRYLQQLYEDGILNNIEYGEQKEKILSTLKKLD